MLRTAKIAIGAAMLLLVTFANPLAGNVLGFCPPSEGAKAISVDAVVATIDALGAWLVYRGLRQG
jgi:hypothetical protein